MNRHHDGIHTQLSNEPVLRIILLRGFAHFGKFGIKGCVLNFETLHGPELILLIMSATFNNFAKFHCQICITVDNNFVLQTDIRKTKCTRTILALPNLNNNFDLSVLIYLSLL